MCSHVHNKAFVVCIIITKLVWLDCVVALYHTLQENLKTLISYVVDNFMTTLETVEYVETFRKLKLKHDQEKDRQENKPEMSAGYVFIHLSLSLSLSLSLMLTNIHVHTHT